jgi:hypothetical protein
MRFYLTFLDDLVDMNKVFFLTSDSIYENHEFVENRNPLRINAGRPFSLVWPAGWRPRRFAHGLFSGTPA